MNLHPLVLPTMGILFFTGCPDKNTADCPIYEDLNQDQHVTIADLKQLSENWSTETIECEMLCASIEYQISGFETDISDCTLELDISAYQEDPSLAEDNSVVGTIQCTGESFTLCE